MGTVIQQHISPQQARKNQLLADLDLVPLDTRE